MIQVKDGARTLQFNGTLLGKSSSYRKDSLRWIEFELYKTENGSYVLSRIGVSVIYHCAACHLVKRYSLQDIPVNDVPKDRVQLLVPCDVCTPSFAAELIFPEKNRYWAQVSDDPSAVLDALYKYDNGGARYLTNVAQRLLEQAASLDKGIESVYKIEMIP
jgi:hypothetical protein